MVENRLCLLSAVALDLVVGRYHVFCSDLVLALNRDI